MQPKLENLLPLVTAPLFLVLVACATTEFWERPGIAVIPGTISWAGYGTNYKISGVIQDGAGVRVPVYTFATDCLEGQGDLRAEEASKEFETSPGDRALGLMTKFVPSEIVVMSGASSADRVFRQLCSETLDEIVAYEESIPDDVRARRDQAVRRALGTTMQALPPPLPAPASPPAQPPPIMDVVCESFERNGVTQTECRERPRN
jgi:hypothetical protein